MSEAKLTILSEVCRGQVYELTEEHYGIGRAEDMDIHIPDPTISGMHCELVMGEDGQYRAVDQGYSTNGTRINGMLVDDAYLNNGDILQIGSVECMFECEGDFTPQLTGTTTNIHIDEGTLDANLGGNVAPSWWNSQDPKARLAFKIIWTILGILVLGLGAALTVSILRG